MKNWRSFLTTLSFVCALVQQAFAAGPHATVVRQYRADTGAQITFGTGTVPTGVGVYFEANVTSDEGRTVRLDVELRQLPATFTGTPNYSSSLVSSGTRARTTTATGMAAGNWGWKYRIVDSTGVSTGWQPAGNPDFIVQSSSTVPTVQTVAATGKTATSATINGTITSDGGSAIVERRFDWGTSSGNLNQWTAAVSVSGNNFSYNLSGLSPGTTYFFRAWAKNGSTANVGHGAGWNIGSILSFTTSASCSYSISPSSASPSASSGSGSFSMTAGSGCSWSASTAYSWIHTTSSGTGNGTISYTYDANTSTSSRSGTITAGGQTFTITQAGTSCSYSISPSSASPGASSGSGSFSMTAGSGCSWSASTAYSWIHTTSSGSGNGTVSYTYDANPSTSSRSGTITAGGRTFTITQQGTACSYSISPSSASPSASSSSGSFSMTAGSGCSWSASTAYSWIHTTSSGSGNGTVSYTYDANPSTSSRSGTITAGGKIFTITQSGSTGISRFLAFPLVGYTAYNNKLVTSVFDHYSGGVLTHQVTSTAADNIVEAFNGEHAEKVFGDDGSGGYRKDFQGTPVNLDGIYKYTGTAAQYLQYDGHRGIDFGVAQGTAVFAAAGGTVDAAGWENDADHSQGFGLRVRLRHSNGYYTYYAHLSSISVSAGATVAGGDPLGLSGTTGSSTAPHLHFEVRSQTTGASRDPYGYQGSDVLWTTAVTCSFALSPTSASPGAGSGSGSFSVAAGSGCSWIASTPSSWIHTITSGSGNGTVNYTIDANTSTTSRTGTITVQGQTFTITQSGASCSYAVSPASAGPGSGSGSGSFSVTAGSGCAWSASTAYSWIHTTSSGSGNGTVSYTYDANPSTSSRSGTITAGGRTFTITQQGTACSYSISPSSASPSASSGSGSLSMTAGSGCSWSASTAYSWIHTTSSGSGSSTVSYTYDANTSASSRAGTITVGGQTFTITQAGTGGGISVPITQDFIPVGRDNRPGYAMTANYITIHDTDNTSFGANAAMHAIYVKGDEAAAIPASWHFTVDDHEIYQHLPTTENGWHAGDGLTGTGNRQSVGVEICMNSDGNRAQAEENAAWLTAKLLTDLGLTIDRVKQHNYFSPVGKNCPSVLRSRPGGWDGFLARVASYLGSCTYSISPISANSGASSGSGSFNVTAGSGCSWSASATHSWIHTTSSGSGNGTVSYTYDANASTSSRSGTITAGGQTFTLTQGGTVSTPAITSPSPGSTLSSSSATFQWSSGTGVTEYYLVVGTSFATSDIYGQSQGLSLSVLVNSLPVNGSTLYVRLFWQISGTWYAADYTYTAATSCSYSLSPTTASPSASSGSGSFGMTAGSGCSWSASTAYGWIHTTSSGSGNGTVSYTYDANTSTSSRSGTITAGGQTFTLTQAGTVSTPAITSPSPGSTLLSSSATFQWSSGTGVTEFYLSVGSALGGFDIYGQYVGLNLSATVTGLPINGSALYVKLYWQIAGVWYAADYTYTAATICSYSLSPSSASPGASSGSGSFNVTAGSGCSWSASTAYSWIHTTGSGSGNGTVSYTYDANTSPSSRSGTITVGGQTFTITQAGVPCSYSVSPSSASPSASSGSGSFNVTTGSGCSWSASTADSWIHTTSSGSGNGTVSFAYDANTSTSSRSGTITAGGQTFTITQAGAVSTPAITSPPPGSTLSSSSATFQWSSGTAVTEFYLSVGSALGGVDIYGQYVGLNLSASVTGLPINGSALYVKLYWQIAGVWYAADYTYTAATPVPPANDAFADRIVISGSGGTATSSNVGATKETGEPNHFGNTGGKSVWWTWTAPSNGTATVDTIGSSFDTVLSIYTGTAVNNLALVASDDDRGGSLSSKTNFTAIAGTAYQIAVDGFGGASGNILLHVAFVPAGSLPTFTGVGGGPLAPPSNGQFQIEVHATQAQVIVQASTNLVQWTDVTTLNMVNGKAVFVDGNAGAHPNRFYRLKP